MSVACFIGIDVQVRRGCAYRALDGNGETIGSGWVDTDSFTDTADELADIVRRHGKRRLRSVAVGIDAPRVPLPAPRDWYWNSGNSTWRRRRPSEKGYGRHCEVVVRALKVANPQWTRPRAESPDWMRLGYAVFAAMPREAITYEVFPSASYRLLDDNRDVRATIDFAEFSRGPKDMLDACVAAVTVREFVSGHGCEVGGGDGLGSIVLPRVPQPGRAHGLFDWPGSQP